MRGINVRKGRSASGRIVRNQGIFAAGIDRSVSAEHGTVVDINVQLGTAGRFALSVEDVDVR